MKEEQTTYVAKQCTAWVPINPADSAFLEPGAGQPIPGETNVMPANADMLSKYNTWLLGDDGATGT